MALREKADDGWRRSCEGGCPSGEIITSVMQGKLPRHFRDDPRSGGLSFWSAVLGLPPYYFKPAARRRL